MELEKESKTINGTELSIKWLESVLFIYFDVVYISKF